MSVKPIKNEIEKHEKIKENERPSLTYHIGLCITNTTKPVVL